MPPLPAIASNQQQTTNNQQLNSIMTLESMRAFPDRLANTVRGVRDATTLEAEGKWSVTDVVAHLVDLELVYAVRIRDILAGSGERVLQPLDQNAWIERVHRREPVSELLEQFAFLRRMNLALAERLNEAERAHSGTHPQYGALSVAGAFERLARHDERHHAQIERIARAVGG
jgi:hypothetical protein